MRGVLCSFCALACYIVVFQPCGVLNAQDDVLQTIERDWRTRRQLVSGVAYDLSGEVMVPAGICSEDVLDLLGESGVYPATDHHYPVERRLLLDFAGNRVRRERTYDAFIVMEKRFQRKTTAYLFDGREAQMYQPRDQKERPGRYDTDLVLENKDGSGFLDSSDYALFFAHGITSISDAATLATQQIDLDLSSFRVVGRTDFEGRDVVVIHSPVRKFGDFSEFWVDVERQSAIVQWLDRKLNQLPRCALRVSYRETEYGWYPARWTFEWRIDNEVQQTEAIEVRKITFNPEFRTEDFHVSPQPNMTIHDRRTGAEYLLTDDGTKRDLPTLRLQNLRTPSSSVGYGKVIGTVLAILAIAIAIALVVRRRTRRHT